MVPSKSNPSNQEISIDHITATISVCNENFFCSEKTQTLLNLLKESQDEFITITIPELKEVKLSSTNTHYTDMAQGTSVAIATYHLYWDSVDTKKLIQVGFAYVIKYMKSFANPRNLKTFREATVSNEKLWRAAPNLLVSNGKILLTGRQSEH